MLLDAPGSVHVSTESDTSGNYTLTGFGSGAYTVTPSKAGQTCPSTSPNGIMAMDATMISRFAADW